MTETIFKKKQTALTSAHLHLLAATAVGVLFMPPLFLTQTPAPENRPECKVGLETLNYMVGFASLPFHLFLVCNMFGLLKLSRWEFTRIFEYHWRMAATAGVLLMTVAAMTMSVILVIQTGLLTCGRNHAGYAVAALFDGLVRSASLVYFWLRSYRIGDWDANDSSDLDIV